MATVRKTEAEFLSDSYNRALQQSMEIIQNDENTYYVFNEQGTSYYLITVDNDSETILECTCPHYYYRLSKLQIPCKHIIKVALYLGYNY